jgi:alanine-glyoxylate transaminase / serine-glyoxylate transaminase / serine-pyruvate transaminase
MNSTFDAPKLDTLNIPYRLLMGPGPSLVDPRVIKAMGSPLMGHLDPQFLKVMDQIQALLRYVFQTENPLTLAVPGTGTAAMEAAVANLTEPGDKVLVCVKGYFGGRIAEMAGRYGAEVEIIKRPWGQVFTAEEVESALQQSPVKWVGIVHAETSTGALQPLEEIAETVHAAGALLLVDTVTSLGGIPLSVDEIGIDACYSGSQKCIGSPPGSSPITFGTKAVEALKNRKQPVGSWYLDLSLLERYWSQDRVYHHTAPISTCYALHEALLNIAEEGLEARWQRHRRNAELLWDGLQEMGLELHVPREHRLPALTTVRSPKGVIEAQVRRSLLEKYNIEIGGGLGELKDKVWRVGLMGYTSRPENVVLFLGALRDVLRKN